MKPREAVHVRICMSRPRQLLSITAVALILAGCLSGDSDPVPASLPGSYVYAGRGSTFKKPWQFAAWLDLTPDKRFTLTLDKAIEGKADPRETTTGTYTVSGDHIVLREGEGQAKSSQDMHKLVIKADSLVAEVGWTAELFIKGVGAPNVVFVKQRRG